MEVPSTLAADEVRLIPLGGWGEIGMNCLAVEQRDGILLIDCGTTFPHDDVGVRVIHPDFTWLREQRDRLSGVIITHGHEDHIGAVPYLIEEIDREFPIYGPPHALQLIRHRLEEFEMDADLLREVRAGERVQMGPFGIEPIRVSHSIIDATGLALRTAAGLFIHTGDFDMDPAQPAGEPIDEARFRALGDEGVRLLLSDSTNVDVPDRARSEADVADALERLVHAADGRVVVALFASNIHRMKKLGELARASRRRICLLGRSLVTQRAAASAIERLDWPSDLVVPPEQAAQVPRRELMVLAGGTQAELGSSMRRLASMTHNSLRLDEGDTVIFSSRIIPGNDRPVFDMINDLLRQGVVVHHRLTDPDIHTSGHAPRSEQRRMLEWVRPQAFVPVHGTLHHLRRHEALAREVGVVETMVAENGTPVLVSKNGALRVQAPVPHGMVRIAWGGETLEEGIRRQRQELGRSGVVFVSIAIDRNRRLFGRPEITLLGVPTGFDPELTSQLARVVARKLEATSRHRMESPEEVARREVRGFLRDRCGERPRVEVHVMRV